MPEIDLHETIIAADPDELDATLRQMDTEQGVESKWNWQFWGRPNQKAPAGDWRTWLIMAGRGFGKTRAGAEWVSTVALEHPDARIALIGASLHEARAVMVEGESGLLSVGRPDRRPVYEPSLRRLSWTSGAQATLYAAWEPESLRGPQHSHAWCDEIGKWDNARERAMRTWDNLLLGLRLGDHPRIVATTTPRSVPLLRRLLDETTDDLAVTRGSSEDNKDNLPPRFLRDVRRTFGRTLLGRQELDGELIEDVPGALWTRAMIEECREGPERDTIREGWQRVVVGVDPPASGNGDACGIVVVGLHVDGIARVLHDGSLLKPSPERWARKVARVAEAWHADRVIAESNQGGQMVRSVLHAADISLPVKLVHASRGKVARAEPIAALYEAGRVRHAEVFAALEDEMCGLIAGGSYEGPGRSPDRADALVWALTELMLSQRAEPRIRMLGDP